MRTLNLVNVYPMDHPELTFEELKEKVDSGFFGSGGGRIRVNHYRNFSGKRVWHLDRVERAEANPEFEKQRNLGKRVHADAVWVDEILDDREFQRVRRISFHHLRPVNWTALSLLRLVCCRGRDWVFERHMGAKNFWPIIRR